MIRSRALAAGLSLLSVSALAQTQPIPPGFLPVAVATGSISATTTPTSTSISSVPTVWATNQGNVPVCVDWGTAPAPAFPCGSAKKQIGAGETLAFLTLGAASFGAVTQTGTAIVSLVEGYVAPAPASSGGGSVVTADQGMPNSVGNAWPVNLVWGGAAVGLTNAVPVQPGTGATFAVAPLPTGSNLIGSVSTSSRVDVTPTVQNAAYVSGNSVGGLVSFTLPRTATGILQSVSIQFIDGATTRVNEYCFDANPTGSTFADKSTFTIAAADEAKRINKVGFALTPMSIIGDSTAGATVNNYGEPFNSTQMIYCAVVSTGTFTPASTTDVRMSITYVQNAL